VCKANQQVYNWITKEDSQTKSKQMYNNSNFKSDLINSYAWDTAIIFIQKITGDLKYANIPGNLKTSKSEPQTTGENILEETSKIDMECNIYDMAGNVVEWSTEACNNSKNDCVNRGGYYSNIYSFTSTRYNLIDDIYSNQGFRPILYM